MPRLILFDQLRISVLVREDLPRRQARRISRLLGRSQFRRGLADTVRAAFRTFPELKGVRVRLSR